MPRNSGALVVGYRQGDQRRYARVVGRREMVVGGQRVPILGSLGRLVRLPPDLQCHTVGGRCVSCGEDVYLNSLGYSAVLEKDADVCCMDCEDRYSAEITRSL